MPHAINPVRPRTVHPLRILYADDFIELRNFLHTLLTRDGHLVETVADGREARSGRHRAAKRLGPPALLVHL